MAADPAIRIFEPCDLPALQGIREAAFGPIFRSFHNIVGDEIASIAYAEADAEQRKLLEDICGAGSDHDVLVVTLGDDIVGFVSFTIDRNRRTGEIGLNAVHPQHSGRGIGAWMYDQVLCRMSEAGVVVVKVSTGGDAGHAPARRAYEKVGFGGGIPSLTLHKQL